MKAYHAAHWPVGGLSYRIEGDRDAPVTGWDDGNNRDSGNDHLCCDIRHHVVLLGEKDDSGLIVNTYADASEVPKADTVG